MVWCVVLKLTNTYISEMANNTFKTHWSAKYNNEIEIVLKHVKNASDYTCMNKYNKVTTCESEFSGVKLKL